MTIKIDGTNGIVLPNGTAALPSTTGPDLDTGISYGDNTLRFSTGGVTAMTIDAGQNVTFNNSPTNGMRNRIINGDMRINQRNTPLTASGYSVDRWNYSTSNIGKFTVSQQTFTSLPGFQAGLYAVSSSAYTPATSDFFGLAQFIEGYNIYDLGWGTASAKTATLSFWVFSSLAGTFGGAVRNGSITHSYPFTYNVPTANVWTYLTVTVPGPTVGTWATDNTAGAMVFFSLGMGSQFVAPAANAWQAGNYLTPPGTVSHVATNAAYLYITGVQFELGAVASSFERRMYGTELALCQRYYETGYNIWSGYTNGSSNYYVSSSYKVTKRTAATLSFSGIATSGFAVTAPTIGLTDTQQFRADLTSNGASTAGYYQFNYAASAEL